MTPRALLLLTAVLMAPTAAAVEVDLDWAFTGTHVHVAVGERELAESEATTGMQIGPAPQEAQASTHAEPQHPSEPAERSPPPTIVVDFLEPIDLDHVASVGRALPLVSDLTAAPRPSAPAARAPAPAPSASPPPSPPAEPSVTPAAVSVAAIATVAAVGAAGPAAAFPWERLKRFLVLAGLYTRIARERLLDHEARERLLGAIRAKPGLPLGDAARAAALPRNTAVYHLRRLEKEGLVSSVRKGRARLYFAPGSLDQLPRADAVAALRHPMTAQLATSVGAKPGVDQQALCRHLNIAPSLAHWHATRLVDAGIVRRERDGRHVRYYPGPSFDLVAVRSA